MVVEQNRKIPGIYFNRGFDVTADILNAMQQYLDDEIINRTKDFIEYPGFAYGFQVGSISGQSITITSGVGFDQEGRRLYQSKSQSYRVSFPSTGSDITDGYLCVKAYAKDIKYKIHPFNGERLPVETSLGLELFIDTEYYISPQGNVYPSDNNGLVLTKLTISGSSYTWDSTVYRSPYIKLRDGT